MATSSILGGERAPAHPTGRESDLLGPSDRSDTGSDSRGTHEPRADSDYAGTGERGSVVPGDAEEGRDVLPDRVVNLGDNEGFPEADPDTEEFTDLDADREGRFRPAGGREKHGR